MQIIVAPDSRLNQISKKVEIIDDLITSTLDQMLECMYQNNGIGLAAPQVGILKRLVVIDCSDNKHIRKPLKLINPEITELSKNLKNKLRIDFYQKFGGKDELINVLNNKKYRNIIILSNNFEKIILILFDDMLKYVNMI